MCDMVWQWVSQGGRHSAPFKQSSGAWPLIGSLYELSGRYGGAGTRVYLEVDHLVVPEQPDEAPSCSLCSFLHVLEELYNLNGVGPAVDEVTSLDERAIASCPGVRFVGNASQGERCSRLGEVAVNISKADDAALAVTSIFFDCRYGISVPAGVVFAR